MEDDELNSYRLKIIRLLMEDSIIRKESYKYEEVEVDGYIEKQRVYNGHKPIECKISDWKKSNGRRSQKARERIRLVLQEICRISKDARKVSLKIDKKRGN